MLIITGPTAAGKNTVAKRLAEARERCAVVDFDLVRRMFVKPHRPPWVGEEGRSQQLLGVRHVCALAHGFAEAGWEVIVLDVLSEETARIYREQLSRFRPGIVQLLPAFDELSRRFRERGPVLTNEEFRAVYEEQSSFTHYDLRVDNTELGPDEVAARLAPFLRG